MVILNAQTPNNQNGYLTTVLLPPAQSLSYTSSPSTTNRGNLRVNDVAWGNIIETQGGSNVEIISLRMVNLSDDNLTWRLRRSSGKFTTTFMAGYVAAHSSEDVITPDSTWCLHDAGENTYGNGYFFVVDSTGWTMNSGTTTALEFSAFVTFRFSY